ncbi:hypothetical protein [Neolewinella persica]|uniref:hypothetical protein n=1 Tax=Neolewinella persica TaxID=70998 RepID=UPI00036D696E|nr:hypothetical protein [Neolewinella persica]
MKLTILNKLEKQLRASRGREIPDLTPPPGGWESINAALNEDPIGEQPRVGSTVLPAWVKLGAGGMGILLLVIVAVLMPPGMNVPEEQEAVTGAQQASALDKVADVEKVSRIPEQREVQRNEERGTGTSKTTDSYDIVKPDEIIAPAGKRTFVEQREENISEQKVAEEQREERSGSNELTGKVAGKSEVPVTVDLQSGITLPVTSVDEAESTAIDTADREEVGPEPKSGTSTAVNRSVYLPVELPSLLFSLVSPTEQWSTPLPPVASGNRGLFKIRRLRARSEWQFHGSVSGFVGEDYDGTLAYNVAPVGSSGTFFVRPSGGLIHVEPDAVRGNSNRLEQIYLKAGVNRQTSSGLLFRSSIGVFRSKSFQIGPDGELMADEVEVKTAKNETIVPVELGLQYTFLRRRRVKPYVGIHLVGYLNYLGVDESYFTEGATAEEGLVSRRHDQEFIALAPDLAVTLGLQYQLTRRISAGAFLWENLGGNFHAQAPFGMEVRYSLK